MVSFFLQHLQFFGLWKGFIGTLIRPCGFSASRDRQDILDGTKDGTRTDRFVKWINRRNVRRRQAKQEVRLTTHRVLNSSQSGGNSVRNERTIPLTDGSYEGDDLDDPLSQWECISDAFQPSSSQWECLSDPGDMELCTMSGSMFDIEDSLVSQESLRGTLSREELMKARSLPTLAEALSNDDDMEPPYQNSETPLGVFT